MGEITDKQKIKAIEFLDGCDQDVEDFPNKLMEWLHVATISHLRNPVNGGLSEQQAERIIWEWLSRRQHGNAK